MQLTNWTIIKALKAESYIYYLKGNVFGHAKPTCGYIRNVGAAPIAVTFSFGGTVTIMPGKMYEVRPPEQGSAGK